VEDPATPHLRIEVYGLEMLVVGNWPAVMDGLRRDFAWFERPGPGPVPAAVSLTIHRQPPDFARFDSVPAAFVTPRNIVFQEDDRTIVDYLGRALSVLDRSTGSMLIEGEDEHLVREAAYHFLLSRVGEHLEHRKLVRLHALGLATPRGGVALMLPSGGGKSTLALRALKDDGVKLLSEDTPLLDRRGRMHPFPLPIGINEAQAAQFDQRHVRRLERMEFHAKLALDIEAFSNKVARRPQALRHLVIGRRTLGSETRLEPLARRHAVGTMLREVVVGVGVYQGMEFVLQRGMRDVVGKLGIVGTRVLCSAAAIAEANVWRLTMARDHDQNWKALAPLLGDGEVR
jgi:hypothetical protein